MKKYYLFLMIICVYSSYAQKEIKQKANNTWKENIKEVVVTGQINPQSVKKSVYEVKVINRKTIENLAANNLADVLNQSLNINIIPNTSTGKSSVNLFGLDGQYFKILIDNIPMVNDEGMGNMADLTQINLDDVACIQDVFGDIHIKGSDKIIKIDKDEISENDREKLVEVLTQKTHHQLV